MRIVHCHDITSQEVSSVVSDLWPDWWQTYTWRRWHVSGNDMNPGDTYAPGQRLQSPSPSLALPVAVSDAILQGLTQCWCWSEPLKATGCVKWCVSTRGGVGFQDKWPQTDSVTAIRGQLCGGILYEAGILVCWWRPEPHIEGWAV